VAGYEESAESQEEDPKYNPHHHGYQAAGRSWSGAHIPIHVVRKWDARCSPKVREPRKNPPAIRPQNERDPASRRTHWPPAATRTPARSWTRSRAAGRSAGPSQPPGARPRRFRGTARKPPAGTPRDARYVLAAGGTPRRRP